ncbi:uncharacterized protein LOC101677669 [Mustela putorius furo]|uniref:Uncharacterized protein LOC101677669 n=1 Tax=Mustela putorius furo TaxID=9669 RepID=A0A8U0SHT1_MUSPF|nr:uncharacterized protein LOC101677669 [Mustela putorius furo]
MPGWQTPCFSTSKALLYMPEWVEAFTCLHVCTRVCVCLCACVEGVAGAGGLPWGDPALWHSGPCLGTSASVTSGKSRHKAGGALGCCLAPPVPGNPPSRQRMTRRVWGPLVWVTLQPRMQAGPAALRAHRDPGPRLRLCLRVPLPLPCLSSSRRRGLSWKDHRQVGRLSALRLGRSRKCRANRPAQEAAPGRETNGKCCFSTVTALLGSRRASPRLGTSQKCLWVLLLGTKPGSRLPSTASAHSGPARNIQQVRKTQMGVDCDPQALDTPQQLPSCPWGLGLSFRPAGGSPPVTVQGGTPTAFVCLC